MTFLSLILALCLPSSLLAGFSKLSPQDLAQLETGKIITRARPIKDAPWPEYLVFLYLKNTTPLEAISVFADYNHQTAYNTSMTQSQVTKQISPTEVVVSYTIDIPILSDAKYVNRHQLTKRGQNYLVFWNQVESNSTKDNRGSALFSPHGLGTLLTYNSFVYPESFFASWVKSKAASDLQDSLLSFRDYLGRLKSENKLSDKIQRVQKSLAGKMVY